MASIGIQANNISGATWTNTRSDNNSIGLGIGGSNRANIEVWGAEGKLLTYRGTASGQNA